MRDHTEIEELFALEALGGLEADDRARVATITAEHGADCAECAELRGGFSETAAMLGAALAPTPLSAGLEARTVAAALGSSAPSAAGAPAGRWRVAVVAVAAAVVLVAVGALGGYLAAPKNGFEAFVNQPGVQLIPFEPADGGSGTMTLAVSPDGSSGYVIGSGLQAPPDGQVYELWTIAGKTPTSIGCLVPTDGVVNQPLTGSFGTADVAAMTVEPSACPAAPSTPPVQVATL
jgi:anti-sigma-K factor RskA